MCLTYEWHMSVPHEPKHKSIALHFPAITILCYVYIMLSYIELCCCKVLLANFWQSKMNLDKSSIYKWFFFPCFYLTETFFELIIMFHGFSIMTSLFSLCSPHQPTNEPTDVADVAKLHQPAWYAALPGERSPADSGWMCWGELLRLKSLFVVLPQKKWRCWSDQATDFRFQYH